MSFLGKQLPAGQSVDVLASAGFFHVGKSIFKYYTTRNVCHCSEFETVVVAMIDKNM